MPAAFRGRIWHWRGPAPHHFVTCPVQVSDALEAGVYGQSYGWGAIPVSVRIGEVGWQTSVFPKDGRYVVPIKADVRRRLGVDVGDEVAIVLGPAGRGAGPRIDA